MATNYLALLRKSYFNKLLFSSLLSNMVVFGQPLQEMILSAKTAPVQPATGAAYTSPSIPPAQNMLPGDKILGAPNTTPQAYFPGTAFTVFYAKETQAIVGTDPLSGIENPYDNFFTVQLPQGLDANAYETVLTYELYGVAGAAQTTKRVNSMPAYGGKVVTLSQEWLTVSETLPPGYLKAGANEVFFNRRGEEMYQYKVRNLRVELKEKTGNDLVFYAAQTPDEDKSLHLAATVLNPEIKEIEVLGEIIPVYEGVAEKVLANLPEGLTSLDAVFTTSKGEQHVTVPVVQVAVKPQYNFPASILAANASVFTPADFGGEGVAYEAVTLQANEKAGENSRVAVSGLQFKDLKALNPDMEIVTGGSYTGYRIQQLNFPDSVATSIHLKYDPEKIPTGYTAQDVRTYYYDAAQRTWQQLAVDSLDSKKNEVVVKAFGNDTDYINGVIKVPDSPETSSFAPTTITDMKLADPSAGVVSIAPPTPNSSGTANTSFPLKLPQGRHGQQPSLQVTYNSEAGNGWMGVGWNLSTPAISLNTKWGAPLFNGSYETEMYTLNGSELVFKTTVGGNEIYTSPNRNSGIVRTTDKQFYERKEGAYQHIVRKGNHPSNYFWIVTDKQGNKSYYGGITAAEDNAVIRDNDNNIAHWALRRTQDTYGNYVDYNYFKGTTAVGTSAISGQEFYISSIEYTKSSPSDNNFYRVQFIRNIYSTTLSGQSNTELNRADVSVSARNGVVQITDDLLAEVHVSIVQSGTPVVIRKYRFDYGVTSFQKNQLEEISEFDSQGKLFYSNTLEYYPMDNASILSGGTTYSGGTDDVQSPLPNLTGGSPTGSALGTSTANGFSFGLRAGLGYGFKVWDIGTSVGGSVSYSKNTQESKISFIDINGDGLPDKVVSNGSGRYYRPNTGSGFGSPVTILDLSELSKSKSRTVGGGIDASFGPIASGKSWSKTKTETDNYFSDFNGDGLPDVVAGGRVKFNITGPSGDPMQRKFDNSPELSENDIVPGIISQDLIPDLKLETLDMLREQNPQFDHVKIWEAPYDGVVNITGNARLVAVNTQGNLLNRFKISIERATATQITGTAYQELSNESTTFNTVTTGTGVAMNKSNIAVAKGDKLMFRIHNLNYGFGGKVEWNPVIKYASLTNITDANVTDDNSKSLKDYDAFQDYIVDNDGGLNINASSGTLNVNFNLDPYPIPFFSDNLTFRIKVTRTDANGNEYNTTFSVTYNHETGNFSPEDPNGTNNNVTLNSSYKYSVVAYVESTSNVKWEALKWKPTLYHASLGTQYIPVNYHGYDDNVYQSAYWINASSFPAPVFINNDTSTHMITFSHNLLDQDFSSAMSNMAANTYIPVYWLIKQQKGTTTTVLSRRTIYIYKNSTGGIVFAKNSSGSPILSTDTAYWQYSLSKIKVQTLRNASYRLYSAFYIDNKEFADPDVDITVGLHTNQTSNYTFTNVILDKPYFSRITGQFGRPYRGWTQFLYNGGIKFEHDDEGEIDPNSTPESFAGPIDLSIFDMESQQDQLEQYQNTDPEDMEINDAPVRFATYKEKNEVLSYENASVIGSLYGLNTSGALIATIGRFGEANLYDVYIDPTSITTAVAGVYPGLRQRSESKGKAVSAGAYASGTESEATSKVLNQYIDINGDRYPDIVTQNIIQYTDMLGALSTKQLSNNFASGDSSKDWTVGVTIPCSPPNSTNNSNGQSTGKKTNTNISSGINGGNGQSFDANQWVDINGDGLPDKVKISGNTIQVQLNTGYNFTETFDWYTNTTDYITNTRGNVSVSVSGGGLLGVNSSLSFGVGATTSTANTETFLNDVNGDGLPDLIYRTSISSPYVYRLNTGEGFSSQAFSFYSSALETNASTSANVFGSYTFGFPIPLFLITLKVVITPSVGVNTTLSNTNRSLQDINGDGLVDVVETESDNGTLTAKLNQTGKANLLRKVNTPLGGSWTINYTRNGNTYDMPQSKWVLTSIETHDGFTGDNAFGPSTTKTAVSYSNPKQDRQEREFLGYGTVTVQEMDPDSNSVYRTAVTSYHTENIYLSGLAKETILYDSSLQMLSKESTLYNILDPDTPVVNAAATAVDNYLQASLIATGADLLDRSRLFVAPAKTTATTYEGSQELSASKEFLSYNEYGSLLEYKDNGEGEDDAFKTVITYHTVSQYMPYGPGFPSKVSVYKNAGNVLMREREATYYNTTGGLYEISTKLNTAGDYGKARFAYDAFGNMTQVSDLENKNSANTTYYTKTIAYDTVFKMFPMSITNGYGETSTVEEYNFWFGIPMLVKDVNGEEMRTRIDNRGRVIEVTGPNEMAVETDYGGNAWTIRMEYENEAVLGTIASGTYMVDALGSFRADPAGSALPTAKKHHAVTRHFDPEYATGNGLASTNQFLTMTLVDGFGQSIQVKKTHQTGAATKWMVSGFEKKDAYGRVLETYLPIVENTYPANPVVAITPVSGTTSPYNYNPGSGIQPFTVITYDAKDRVTTTQQVGISGNGEAVYSIEGGRYVQKLTNELGQTMEAYTDLRGRRRKTVQNGEITTTFEYNAISEVTKVIDNEGFSTEYLYDLAGRKTETHHPDKGVVTFKYDKAGRITELSNSNLLPSGLKINYFYNYSRVERIEYPQNPQNNVTYTYGLPGNQLAIDERAIGRLLTQEDATGKQLFSYGRMGEVVEHLRSVAVADYQSYWFFTQWKYDSWNRVQEITYPDQEVVTYAYNKAGAIQGINSQMNGIAGNAAQPVVSNILYNDFGERVSITHGFGSGATTTTYTYDARRRMNTLAHTFSNLSISKNYAYDALSNITDITTATPQNSLPGTGNIGGPIEHHYTYDDYNRLEHAEGVYTGANDLTTPYLRTTYSLDMEYNTDHTIKKKTQLQEQGWVNAYSDTAINDQRPVQKTSYTLDYGGYGDASIMMGSYGYQQPHAPRNITESPSWVTNPAPDDPRIKQKKILYDANGNQTEIKEVLGEVETSLRKNLWDEENRLKAVNLKPDDTTAHPIAIYTYDAGGERTIRYNYDRIDVSSNATEVDEARKDNVMVYPSGLIMGKAARMIKDGTVTGNTLVYTKHYYIGSERVSAKTGTLAKFGDYPQTLVNGKIPQMATLGNTLMRTPSTVTQQEATATVVSIHNTFGVTPPTIPTVQQESTMTYGTHDQNLLNSYYFHPDHLGSSSYITNSSGVVCQHMEYLPFGETLVDEHLNSNNSPFKYNSKELDEETGNYYYSARYYDPKLSIFISVDPLAEETMDPYGYCYENPIKLIDPTGLGGESAADFYRNSETQAVEWFDGSGKIEGYEHLGVAYTESDAYNNVVAWGESRYGRQVSWSKEGGFYEHNIQLEEVVINVKRSTSERQSGGVNAGVDVDWISQYDTRVPGYGGTACKQACYIMNPDAKRGMINGFYVAKENGKSFITTNQTKQGYQYLDQQLAMHRPVIVGVGRWVDGYWGKNLNGDFTTDHFVVVYLVENGNYHFLDPGTRNSASGKNPNNIFRLGTDGLYKGKSYGSPMTISWIGLNK